jgi:hypothetical protein
MSNQKQIENGNDHGNNYVIIYVNDIGVSIHRGNNSVLEIKTAGKVPLADVLYLMPNYEVALKDNESLVIKGDERFKSSAPSGASS